MPVELQIKALSSLCCTRHLKSVMHFVGTICIYTHVVLSYFFGYTGSPYGSQYNGEVYRYLFFCSCCFVLYPLSLVFVCVSLCR